MIRFKSIKKVYPNGLTWANYYLEDIYNEEWYFSILNLIKLIKIDSPSGWTRIFQDFIQKTKASVFYPIVTSFNDWKKDYNDTDIIKFISQTDAIIEFFNAKDYKHDAGVREFTEKRGYGNRFVFEHQKKRIKEYSKDDICDMLYKLTEFGGAIPIKGYEINYNYGIKVKNFCLDYNKYLEIAYLLPPSWYIMEIYKPRTWLELLIESGILSDGLLKTSRGYRCISNDGHYCNSLSELEIDNWLYLHKINHIKEPLYPFHEKYNPNTKLRADFKVGEILIEYAGLLNNKEYALKMKNKKIIAKDLGLKLIVLTPRNLHRLDEIFKIFIN